MTTRDIANSPRRTALNIDSRLLGMAIFLMAEAMLFAGLISACIVLRARSETVWPPLDQPRMPVWLTMGNMVLLLTSGMVLSFARGRSRHIAVAALLGAVFTSIQGYEWSRLITFGLSQHAAAFAGIFYALVGTHALHVLGGLICLLWAWRSHDTGTTRICSIYWYFVVCVWPVIYLVVYI